MCYIYVRYPLDIKVDYREIWAGDVHLGTPRI